MVAPKRGNKEIASILKQNKKDRLGNITIKHV